MLPIAEPAAEIRPFSRRDIKHMIKESLKEAHIVPELIEIEVQNGPKVILRGEVDTRNDKITIIQTIRDVLGIHNVVDKLVIFDAHDEMYGDDDNGDMLDDDNETMGTDDISRSVEEGVPYIPPMGFSFDDDNMSDRRNHRRRY